MRKAYLLAVIDTAQTPAQLVDVEIKSGPAESITTTSARLYLNITEMGGVDYDDAEKTLLAHIHQHPRYAWVRVFLERPKPPVTAEQVHVLDMLLALVERRGANEVLVNTVHDPEQIEHVRKSIVRLETQLSAQDREQLDALRLRDAKLLSL